MWLGFDQANPSDAPLFRFVYSLENTVFEPTCGTIVVLAGRLLKSASVTAGFVCEDRPNRSAWKSLMKRALIVDDSRAIRMVARRILEPLGFEVSEAENADH